MAHFAKVINGIVEQVIVAEKSFIDSGSVGNPDNWIQTSYNTHGGVHTNGGIPLRKNFAGVGFIYDSELDAFISPSPFPSWVLDKETCLWEAPVAYPNNGEDYVWNEDSLSWKENK